MAKKYIFALLLFALAGLKQPFLAAASGAGKSSQTDSPKTPGDAQIEQAIRAKLAKSKMSADHFTVSVVKGVATIEGSTAIMQHKGAMTRMAKTCGATSVKNNIHVSDAAKAKLTESLTKSRAARAASGGQGTAAIASGASGSTAIPRATVIRQNPSH